jgi:hypothetical protein
MVTWFDICEDLDHSAGLLFHATGLRAASLILATGVIDAKTDDKAYAASGERGVSLTRSYAYANQHRGSFRPKIIFVFKNLRTEPVDYWANHASRRSEAEEWHRGPILLRKYLVSINCPTLSLAEFVATVGESLQTTTDPFTIKALYGDQMPAVQAWHARGYKSAAPLWNRWRPVRGFQEPAKRGSR